jgi:TetR/AcrR family transcriptional repressor of nem operon
MPKERSFTEDAVLQKAMELFWNKGYNGTSMDELTKATGLSRSSMYNSFGDKHALFMKSIRFYQAQQQKALMESVEKGGSAIRKIQLAFRHLLEDILEDKLRKGCLMVNTTTELSNLDKEISTLVLENLQGMENVLYEWVKAGQQQGEISQSFSAQALARHLYNSYNGMRIVGQTKPDRKSLEDIIKVALSVLTA